ncbi:MAG: YlxM family DNA-binding protein [Monoglobales bacterium]
MAKNYQIGLLIDFYGSMLTDRQREVITLYYEEDLSLAEIAENVGITRQGVRDAIKKAEAILTQTEEKLGLAGRFKVLSSKMDIIKEKLCLIDDKNGEIKPLIKMIDEIEI